MYKKAVALFLSVVVVTLTLGSCSSIRARNLIFTLVDNFSAALCARKIDKIIETVEVKNETNALLNAYISGSDLSLNNREVYTYILKTLTYEMDKSSYNISKNKDDAFVDVTFSMIDYKSVDIDDEQSIEVTLDKLSRVENKIQTKVPVRAYFDGERWIVDNTRSIITTLFDELHGTSFSSKSDFEDRIDRALWYNYADYEDGYYNTSEISCMVFVNEYNNIDTKFYYEFYFNDELICVSPLKNLEEGGAKACEISYFYDFLFTDSGVPFIEEHTRLFLSGTYSFKFYDEYGVLFYEDSIECELDSGEYLWIDGTSYSYRWVATIDEYNTYLNPVAISLEIKFGDDTDDLIIDSYYTVTYDDELIYTSEPDSLIPDRGRIYYSFGKFFEECPLVEGDTNLMRSGSYKITVFDSATDEMILEESCFVFVW